MCRFSIYVGSDVERPYYSRSEPTVFTTQPKDGVLSGATPMNISCEAAVEPIVSGWYPHIYWYHNGSIVNSSHQMTVESNHWNQSHLSTVYPGSYQCVLDDGYFVTVSREAQIILDTTRKSQFCAWTSTLKPSGHYGWVSSTYYSYM